jgi:hypothetical protein
MQPEREVHPPSSIRHQNHQMLIVEILAKTAANHHAVPIGACASAPDVRQGALGGRRARLDVVTSGSGSGRALPRRPGEGGYRGFRELGELVPWYSLTRRDE